MKRLAIIASTAALLLWTTDVWGQCDKGSKADAKKAAQSSKNINTSSCQTVKADGAAGKTCAAKACPTVACPVACCAMPRFAYKVGEERTCCEKTAGALAEKNGCQMIYCVGDKEYSGRSEADEAFANLLESYLTQITTVRYMVADKCVACPMHARGLAGESGGTIRYCVGTATFDSEEQAQKAAERAREAADKVKMTMQVDGRPYTCDKSAAKACVKTGKQCTYVVGDEFKTQCQVSARVKLASDRIAAAREAALELGQTVRAAQP
jgi:hypothetical protein